MKVLIHALGAEMGGAMTHICAFLPELSKQDGVNQYCVVVRAPFPELQLAGNVRIEEMTNLIASSWFRRLWNDLFTIPRKIRREKFDVVVSLTNFGPIWSPVPHIFFQRNSLYYCPYYLARIRGKRRIETLLRRRLAFESMKRANRVVTPTAAMAKMIRSVHSSLLPGAFQTLHHGFSSTTVAAGRDELFQNLIDRGKHVIIYPTHPGPHKGFEDLFEILKDLKAKIPGFKLYTTVSRKDWVGVAEYEHLVHRLGLEEHVVFMGRVSQRAMATLYQMADLMIYPSRCESFGFPLLEAMGAAVPIVAADTPVAREICGNAALYYTQGNVREAVNCVRIALSHVGKTGLVEAQRVRMASYDWSWSRYVREFIALVTAYG